MDFKLELNEAIGAKDIDRIVQLSERPEIKAFIQTDNLTKGKKSNPISINMF